MNTRFSRGQTGGVNIGKIIKGLEKIGSVVDKTSDIIDKTGKAVDRTGQVVNRAKQVRTSMKTQKKINQTGGLDFGKILSGLEKLGTVVDKTSDIVDKTGKVVDRTGQVVNRAKQVRSTMVPVKAKQVQANSIVQTQAKYLKNQAMQVKQGRQVVQVKSLPPGQMVHATKEEVRPEAQVLAKQQDVTLKAGQVAQTRPDLTVQAKPTDLKQSQVVLVNKTAVQPSQQARVIQVSSSKVLAKPVQLKQGQLVQVPVQNVTASKQLHQTMEGLSTQKPREARVEQRGGASSDFSGSFYANTVVGGPAAISTFTLNGLHASPMFNPLSMTATFPTMPSTGIVPTGMVMSQMV